MSVAHLKTRWANSRQLRLVQRAVLVMTFASVAIGCGSGASGSGVAAQPAAASVAVRYTQLFLSSNFSAAAAYVLPSAEGEYRALTVGLTRSHVVASNLRAGQIRMVGQLAKVTLTGTFCAAPPSGPATSQCITNSDGSSTNPRYVVTLEKQAAKWYVVFAK